VGVSGRDRGDGGGGGAAVFFLPVDEVVVRGCAQWPWARK
jgi:hypothetical protein